MPLEYDIFQRLFLRLRAGGNNRARTYDPLLVRQMLSQLSYASIVAFAVGDLYIISRVFIFVNTFFEFFEKIFNEIISPFFSFWHIGFAAKIQRLGINRLTITKNNVTIYKT